MPNAALKDKLHHTGDDKKEKYTALAMQETRLKKAKKFGEETGDWTEFRRLGGELELKRLENVIHTAQNTNYGLKKTGMDAGRKNQFIKNHEKDRDNANPTGVGGIPKVNKGSMKDKIMTNKEIYNESELPSVTQSAGIVNIANIDDMKKLIKAVLPEDCYLKRFYQPLSRFEITNQNKPNLNVTIEGRNGVITITNSKGTKSYKTNEISNISNTLRKMVEFELGGCFDTKKINEEISEIRYLIEYMNNNKKQNL